MCRFSWFDQPITPTHCGMVLRKQEGWARVKRGKKIDMHFMYHGYTSDPLSLRVDNNIGTKYVPYIHANRVFLSYAWVRWYVLRMRLTLNGPLIRPPFWYVFFWSLFVGEKLVETVVVVCGTILFFFFAKRRGRFMFSWIPH